jgi:hypothetical protein
VPSDDRNLVEKSEGAQERAHNLDWRIYDLAITPDRGGFLSEKTSLDCWRVERQGAPPLAAVLDKNHSFEGYACSIRPSSSIL